MSDKIKVLLVEDDDLFRSTIRRSLMKAPCEVNEAANGKLAKEMMMMQKFDLVISDIQMPFFSGIDLLEWIKSNQPTPTVLMTGFSQALETKKADDRGADGFLAKPFRESELLEIVNQFLKPVPKVAPAPVNLDKEFCKVAVDEFISSKETLFDIYIRISQSKYIKISHSGGRISDDRILAYKEKGVHFVYIKKEDFPKHVQFNLQIVKIAKESSQINSAKKKLNS